MCVIYIFFFSYLGKTDADHEISKLCDNIQGRYFAKEKNFTQSGKRQLLHKILDGHEYLSENQLFKALNYFSHESGFHSYVKDLLPLVPTNETFTKGQLISKCPFGVIVWTKIPTKFFPKFLP